MKRGVHRGPWGGQGGTHIAAARGWVAIKALFGAYCIRNFLEDKLAKRNA